MFFSVLFCFSVTLLKLVCHTRAQDGVRYECGPHGKFEYCINHYPGCVIGCHCHPGYYFDTETKICEPNTKLTEDYRRRYVADPNLIYPVNTPRYTYLPTQTTTFAYEEKVDEISKDTDDIGDWLYNQFFKTIESQVIKNSSDDQPMTRRSGNGKFRPDSGLKQGEHKKNDGGHKDKIKVKTRKYLKGKGKKNKSKVHGLRRKLLRITEDDSLFDSESDEDSDGDSGSSSSGSSESTSSSGEAKPKDDREHGHKKVIIFNRRPRPPLPSFIFLPSMDTPYYPPIGLPPPPIMPMYPMVPVPPMAPFIPFLDNKNNCTTSATPSIASSSSGDSIPTSDTTTTTTTTTTETPEPSSDNPSSPSENLLRGDRRTKSKIHKHRRPAPVSDEQIYLRSGGPESRISLTPKQSHRIKLLQKLKETLAMQNVEANAFENSDLMDLPENNHRNQKETDEPLKDANFKYLTELIHRKTPNDTVLSPLSANDNIPQKKLEHSPPNRRNYGVPIIDFKSETITPSSLDPNDAVYMSLGRQIASLIRDTGYKMNNYIVTKPTETNYPQESINSVLNENSYAPRSYWERFVRSPLNRLKTYLEELNIYKQNNEKDLLTLENELQSVASTPATLTLQDLENMLAAVQKTYTEINNNNTLTRHSNTSLNVNLLPSKLINEEIVSRRKYRPSDYPGHLHVKNITINNPKKPTTKAILDLESTNVDEPTMDDWIFTARKLTPINKFNQKSIGKPNRHNSAFLSKTPLKPLLLNSKINQNSENQYLKFVKKMPLSTAKHSGLPSAHIDFSAKYPKQLPRFSKLPAKHGEVSAKYNKLNANYPALPAKYPELRAKYLVQTAKYPGKFIKYSEGPKKYPVQFGNFPDLPVKFPEPLAKFPDLHANYPELQAKYPELFAKYPKKSVKFPERPEKSPNQSANLPELYAQYPELSAKYPEQAKHIEPPQKYPKIPAKYPKQSVKHPELLLPNYLELSANLAEVPGKYSKVSGNFPETPAKYPEQSAKYSEPPVEYSDQSVNLPELPAKKDIEAPVKYPMLPAKYPEKSTKYPDLQPKYTEISANLNKIPAKYPELTENLPETPLKLPDQSKKNYELPAKYPELSDNLPEIPANYPELSAKYSEQSAKYPEVPPKYMELSANLPKVPELTGNLPETSAKFPEQSEKYSELPAKYPELSVNLPELPANYPELSAKYSEQSAKYPELSAKYSDTPNNYKSIMENSHELPANYPEVPTKNTDTPKYNREPPENYRKYNLLHPKPGTTIINYKSLNYFSGDGNKHHYMFQAAYPNYKKVGFNFETQKPSYFHHEFHHFDYFE